MDSSRPDCLPDYRREPSTPLPVSIICQTYHLITSQTGRFSLQQLRPCGNLRQQCLGKGSKLLSILQASDRLVLLLRLTVPLCARAGLRQCRQSA